MINFDMWIKTLSDILPAVTSYELYIEISFC